jgi:hypothetical protein
MSMIRCFYHKAETVSFLRYVAAPLLWSLPAWLLHIFSRMPWLIYMDLCSLFDGKALPNPLHHFASTLPALICLSALDESMVRLTPRSLNPTYSLIWSVNGPQSRSGLSQKKEISRLCPESYPALLSPKPTHYGQRCPVPLALISCRIDLCKLCFNLHCVCFNLHCGCFILFCNVWACFCVGFLMCGLVCVCVCVGFVMCGCFGNMYTVLWLRFFLPWLRFFRDFSSVVRQMPG